MRRTERAAYRTKFYSNLSSPTRFDEEPTNNRTYLIRFSLYLNNHYPSNGLFNSKLAYQTRKALSTDFTKRIFLITKFVNRK